MNKTFLAATRFKTFVLIAASLLLCLTIAGLLLGGKSNPPPFLLLRQPFSKPLPARDRLNQWIQGASSLKWLAPFEDLIFGRRKPINLDSEIVAVPESIADSLSTNNPPGLGKPDFVGTNGLQAWLIRNPQLQSLRDYLKRSAGVEFLNRPRISTADGIEASVSVGQTLPGSKNVVGLTADYFPRVHDLSADLFAAIQFTELVTNQDTVAANGAVSVRTNLDILARLQMPRGSGFFLLQGKSALPDHKHFGALIDSF